MIYRDFGKTGEQISAIGFGCLRLPERERDGKWSIDQDKADEMLGYACEHGINYFDTAPFQPIVLHRLRLLYALPQGNRHSVYF